MGTPIRKYAGEQFDSCLDILKTEIQARLKEETTSQEEESDSEDEIDEVNDEEVFLPIMNSSLYQKMEQHLNVLGENKQMEDFQKLANKMSCSNHVSAKLAMELSSGISRFSKDVPAPSQVTQVVKSSFVRGLFHGRNSNDYEPSERLGAFVSIFLNSWSRSSKMEDANVFDLIQELRSFIGQLQTIIASDFALIKEMNMKSANDYGRLFGYLIIMSVLYPQKFIESMSLLEDSDSDESSDEEEVVQRREIKKLSKQQFQAVQKQAKAEATGLISIWFNTLSLCDAGNTVVAGTTYELVSTLLFEKNNLHIFSVRNEARKQRMEKDLADILVSALEMSTIAQKSDLPSSTLIADGKKRCRLIKAWSERTLKSASVKQKVTLLSTSEHMEIDEEQKEELTKNEEQRKCLFILDATPSKNKAGLDEPISEEEVENKSVEDEKTSIASIGVSDSDGRSLFVLDSNPTATVLASEDTESSTEGDVGESNNLTGNDKNESSPATVKSVEKNKHTSKKDIPRKQMQSTPARNRKKSSRASSTLAPVPESEVATTQIDFSVQNDSETTRKRSMSISSNAKDDASFDTPTRMTRSRRRSLSVTSIESSSDLDEKDSEQVVTRRRTRSRGVSIASDGDVSEVDTPLRQSKRKNQNESQTPSKKVEVSTPLRRSARKKR